jgi:YidC/Oxa1 family membrane protein insertase
MKKDLSMEARLLIAFLLMGVVLLVSQYFIKPAPGPTAKPADTKSAPANPAAATDTGAAKAPIPSPKEAQAAASAQQGAIQAYNEQTYPIDTDLFHVEFSNRGATVRSWILKDYKDHDGKPLELVYQRGLTRVPPPFALAFKGTAPSTDPNTALFKEESSDGGNTLSFEFSDGRVLTKKTFHFEPKSYLVQITTEVTQNGVALPHSMTWRGGFGDAAAVGARGGTAATVQHAIYYELPNSKLQVKTAKDAKNGPVSASGQFSFVGIEDSYFAAAFLPANKSSVEETTFSDNVPDNKGADEQRVGVGVGGEGVNTVSLFVGPKDTDLLKKVDPKLEQVVDWGWFWFLAQPLFTVLNWTTDHVARNYGWSIVLVTVVINLVLFPLRLTSMKSSRKMQSLQPQINAINDKFKGMPLKDPRQNDKNAEIMDLYKKNDVNPVGGCLPMLLQLPFLWAFYKVLSVSIEMRGAHWLWVTDLSQPETLAIHMLPVLLIVTQFLTQKMTPSPGMDPSQQKIMLFMPLMFGYMFYFASAGLVLYWLTGNVVAVAQQWALNRISPPPPAVKVIANTKKGRS